MEPTRAQWAAGGARGVVQVKSNFTETDSKYKWEQLLLSAAATFPDRICDHKKVYKRFFAACVLLVLASTHHIQPIPNQRRLLGSF